MRGAQRAAALALAALDDGLGGGGAAALALLGGGLGRRPGGPGLGRCGRERSHFPLGRDFGGREVGSLGQEASGGCGHEAGRLSERAIIAVRSEPPVNRANDRRERFDAGERRLFPNPPGSAIYRLPHWGDVAEWLKATVC